MSKLLLEELKQLETELSQLKKQLFIEMITEGVDDPGILKCIFLAGGPGSGKSFTANEIFGVGKGVFNSVSAGGLKIVNSDSEFENALNQMKVLGFPPPTAFANSYATLKKEIGNLAKMKTAVLGKLHDIDSIQASFDR